MLDCIRDPAEIYRQSFAAIRAEADLTGFPDDVARVVVRSSTPAGRSMSPSTSPSLTTSSRARAPHCEAAPRCCAIRRWWPPESPPRGCPPTTRSCHWSPTRERLSGRPSQHHPLGGRRGALRHGCPARYWPSATHPPPCRLLELIDEGISAPAAVLGGPVGFVGWRSPSRSSSTARAGCPIWWCAVAGAAAQWRPPPSMRSRATRVTVPAEQRGTLWGVGLGPGDPELVTVKAARVIGEAQGVAYHSARHGRSIARGIAEPSAARSSRRTLGLSGDHRSHRSPRRLRRRTRGLLRGCHPGIAAHLDAGRNVALLAEGDPLFYSSYMHLHTRLTQGSTPSSCRA